MNATYDGNNTTVDTGEIDLFYHGLIGLLGSLAMLLNGPLLLVLVKSKTPIFCSRLNYLVGSLALADFLTGLAAVFSSTAIHELSAIHFTLTWTTIGASFITLLLMSVERVVVLSYPLTWPFILTTRRTVAGIAIAWCASLACGLSVNAWGAPAMFALASLYELAILAVVALHGIIFGYLQKRRRSAPTFGEEGAQRKKLHSSEHALAQSNATTVIFILAVVLILTVLPTVVVLQLFAAYWLKYIPESWFDGLAQSHYYLYPVEMVNFVINPIVYAWRLKQYRKALAETFATFKHRLCSFHRDYGNTAAERMTK